MRLKETAALATILVFPTPPFPLVTAITLGRTVVPDVAVVFRLESARFFTTF